MKIIPNNINHIWTALMMEELHRCGVKTVCISPGSRSTPLTWAAAEHPNLDTVVHFDERGLAFHALGIAKASGHPVAIVCTSGSAVANLFPAIVEASMSHVPLLVLTADRPFELVDCGANQTIKQPDIFGDYTRWNSNLPCPTTEISPQTILTTIDHAVSKAQGNTPGPVHLNCPFREPLAPDADGTDGVSYLQPIERWRENETPWTQYSQGTNSDFVDLGECAGYIENTTFGVLVVGQLRSMIDLEMVRELSDALGWPVIADITSGARLGQYVPHVISYADLMLQGTSKDLFTHLETVIHVGGALVSKRIQALFESHPPDHYIRIALSSERLDPAHLMTHRIEYHSNVFHTIAKLNTTKIDTDWREKLVTRSQQFDSFFKLKLSDGPFSEPGVIRAVTAHPNSLGGLFLGNSMPIRDADMFGAPTGNAIWVYANRGASGIDGNIATVAGIANTTQGATAILGDLAALHDLNSLPLLRENKVILIIINNGGGGIFSFLPVAEHGQLVKEFFNTPHEFTFESSAAMFDIAYAQPTALTEFRNVYMSALGSDSSTIIEIITDKEENVEFHRVMENDLNEFLESTTE
jgi:2-succinyl-5-enolpyruvyl-6-hydroxy-3-cyclohexene-1-carboxylate synthase